VPATKLRGMNIPKIKEPAASKMLMKSRTAGVSMVKWGIRECITVIPDSHD
jgi:hypothetical protein